MSEVGPLTLETYWNLKDALRRRGYSSEINWARNVGICADADSFALETIWVILNAGMREQVARVIQSRILPLLRDGKSASGGFGHKLKCKAVDYVWQERVRLFNCWKACDPALRLDWLESLPHIGPVTKYHLARNLGLDCCKPDRHLVRIAAPETPSQMCGRLAAATGDRIGVVDCIIWRAANLGLI